jgi:hypothetical protein
MRLIPGTLVILALLVAAPAAQAAQVNLTKPDDGTTLPVVGDALASIAYAATLQRGVSECLTGDWAIQRRRNGGDWVKVIGASALVPALATTELRPAGRYDVRARLNCPGADPVFSAINTIRVVAQSLPDPPDPLPDPTDVLPDPPVDLPDPPADLPLPPNTGTVQLPGGGSIEVPPTGVIPVGIAGGGGIPDGPGGPVIPLSPSTDDTKLCMVALSDLQAVSDMVRGARRAVRRRSTAKRRAALRSAKRLLVRAKAAEAESCL